ncbi:mucin-12-like isoform X15 [Silurus meridionalis]|uniref:mucin-12-like isoform X15 n=1 Tax=Silurus meridionalis TaxID=175797 RepID=UPI001EEC5EE3|nr:mucin-12-like isoform X15 [Silurus meridionalis]
MWCCKRLWLLLIALVHILDVRALGVWNRRPAQDWYSVDVKMGLDQTQGSSFLPDGGHNSTARRDESKANAGALQNSVVSHAGLSSSDALGTGFSGQSENIFNTIQGFQTQNVGLCAQSTSDQDVPTPEIQTSHGVQSFGMSNHQGLPSPCGGSQTGPAFIVTQQTSENAMSSGSMLGTSSFTNGYQTQGLTGYGLFQGLVSQFGSSQTQPGTNQLSFAPASTVTQQVTDSATTGGSSSFSIPSSPSGSQSPSAYWLSLGLSSPYGGFQTQPGTNQLGSVPASTVTQQVTDSATTGGSPSGSQSSTGYGLFQGLVSQFGSSQTQPGTNQLSSAPASTVTQQVTDSATTGGSPSGSQSSTGYGLFQGLVSQFGSSQTQPGTNQLSSAPASTVTQQVTDSATTGGSSSFSIPSSPSGSQSPSAYWLSLGLSSPYGGFQTQPGTNQLGSVPASTVTQQVTDSATTGGSPSGSQSSTGYGLFQGLVSQFGSSQTQPGTNQLSSAPASTVTQQVTDSATTGGSPSGSQSSTGYGLFQGLVSQFGSSQTQPGTNQLSSAPASTVTQQVTDSATTGGSPSGSQSSTGYGLFQGLVSQFGSSQTQPGTNQLSSAPASTVTQQVTDSATTGGSSSFSIPSSPSGSQSPSAYWLSLGLSSPYGGFQTQPGTNQLSFAPASTVTQQVTDSATTGGSPSGSQSPSAYWLSLGLSSPYGGFQTQPGTNQLSSAPASTVTQQVTDSATTGGSPSGSQSSTGYGLFQGLVSQFGSSQTQPGTNQLSSAPASTVTQQVTDSATTGGSSSFSIPSSPSGSQSPSAYWLSLGLSSPYVGFQTQPGTNQLGSVPASTVTQQVTDSAPTGGSPSGSQSSTGYGLFQGLVSQFGSSQTQPGTNQLSSAPALTVTQQSAETGPSISPPVSVSSSLSGSQSPSAYWLSLGLSSPYGGFQTQPGTNQLASVPASTVTQQVTDSATTGGSSSFSISSSPSGSQSSTGYGLFQGLVNQFGSTQTQPGTNQLSSAPASTVTQQSAETGPSISPPVSLSSSLSGSHSPSAYWLSLGLSSPYGGFQTQPGTNQLSSAPASTVTQQVTDSATTGGSPSGSQSSTGYGLFQGLSSHDGGFQTQPGTNQLSSAPASTVTQQVTDSATTGGSSSFSIPSSPSGSQSSTGYGLFQGLVSQFGSSQTQQGTNQLSSAPASTVTQQSAESGPSISPPVSLSSSLSGSQSPSAYWLSLGLSSPFGGFQTQPGTNQLGSVPASTVTQQVTDSAPTGGSPSGSQSSTGYGLFQGLVSQFGSSQTQPGTNQLSFAPASTVTQQVTDSATTGGSSSFSIPSSPSGSQSPSAYWLSLGLSSPYGGFQTQPGTNQLGSVPASTVTQQVTDSATTGDSPSGSQSSTGYGLFQGLVSQFGSSQTQPGTNQLSSAPALTVTQQVTDSATTGGSPSGSQSPSAYWLSLGLSSPYGGFQTQPGTNQLGSVPASTVTQQVTDSATTGGSSSFSIPSSPSGSQSPSAYWLSLGLSSPYGGFQTQPGTNQLGSVPASTVTQQVTDSATTGDSPSGSQSSTGYGLFQGLVSQFGSSQTQPGTNQLSSAPASTVTQQVTDSATTGGSPSGSQSSTGYGLFQGLVSQFGSSQTQPGTNQLSFAPASTVTQQVTDSATTGGSSSFSIPSSPSGSQSPSAYWLSLGLSSPYGGFQTQPGTNQLGSVPASTVTQQVTDSATTGGSPSGSQSSTGYGLFQGLVSQFGSSQTQPGTNQLSSAPASTVTQQVTDSATTGGSSSFSIPSSPSGSQSPSAYWLSLGLSSPYGGFQTQPGTNQLGSVPASTVTQQVTDSATTGGSPSGSQSPSAYWLSLGLSSPYGGFQTQPGTNQLGSVPASTVTQQVTDSATTGGSPSGSQSSTGYGLFQGLVSQFGSSQTQPGTNQLSFAPASTVTQQVTDSATTGGSSSFSIPSSPSGSQSPSAYWLSLGLSSPYGGFQTQPGTNQLGSVPASTVTQQVTDSATTGGSPSGSQSSTGYGLFQGLVSQFGSSQTQPGTNQLSSAPASTVTQQVTDSATTGGSPSGSQSSTGYGLFQGLVSQFGSSQTQPGTNQLSSAPASTVTQQVTDSATTGGSPSGSQSSTGYGLFQGLVSQFGSSQTQPGTNQLSSAPASTVTQQVTDSATTGGSSSFSIPSSPSGSQSPSAYWLSLGLSSPYGGFQTQPGTNQLSSAPASTVTQQVTDSATTGGSSSFSIPSSPSGSQSSTGYGLFQGLSSPYGGFQTQPGTNQLSSAPASTVTQQVTDSATTGGSPSGSQSSTGYGLFQGLSSHDGGFQTQPGTNQLSSAPASTVTQQVTDSATTGGSSSFSIPSSPSGSQSSTGYGLFQGLVSQFGSSQTQQGTNQLSSAPASTVTQQSAESGPSISPPVSLSSSLSGSQSPSAYWLSLGLSSPFGGFQTQPGTNQLGSVPASTVTQQVTDSATTGGSSSFSISSSPSGSQSSTGYGLFQGLVNQFGSTQTQPGTNQLSSAPASTVTQQSAETGPSISPPVSLSSSLSGSQSSTGYGLFQGLSSHDGGFQTQPGTNQLSSAPASTVTQQVTDSSTTGGSSSFSIPSSPSGSQSPSAYWLSLGLSSPYGGFQTQPGTNQLGSVPASTVTQQVTDSGTTGGSPSGSQSSSGYGLFQGLVSQSGSSQTQPGTNQLSSVPALTVTQQSVESGPSISPPVSLSSSLSGSQSPSAYWLSLGLSSPYGGFQTQQGTNQLSSAPASTVTQQVTGSATTGGSPSGSQSSTGYGLSQQGTNYLGSVTALTSSSASSAFQSQTLSQEQSHNVQQLGTFNQMLPAFWFGHQSCKNNVFSGSSNISKLTSH